MRKIQGIMSTVMVFIAVALVLGLSPARGWTACTVNGSVDSDCDGYSDSEEASPLTLVDGVTTVTLDPAVPDLIVAVVRATGSLMPANPLEYVSNLGIKVIEVSAASVGAPDSCFIDSDRYVTANQRALIICEDLSSNTGPVGGGVKWGSPNRGDGRAWVFTNRIKDVVFGACRNPDKCEEAHTGASGAQAVVEVYIKHTIAHEVFHNMRGVPRDIDQDGIPDDTYTAYGDHYPSPSNPDYSVVMEPSVTYKKGGTVRFYLPVYFANPDFLQADRIFEE